MTEAAAPDREPFAIRSLFFSVYLPTFLFSVGQGAVLPVVPLLARELGASIAAAGFVVAMRGVGTLCFDLPSGLTVSRFGDKGAMIAGSVLVAVVAVGASLSTSILVLGGFIFLMGGGWSFWHVARLTYVSEVTPIRHRGRVLTLLGGVHRAGIFVGPILGGFLGKFYGLHAVFYAQALMGLAAAVTVTLVIRHSVGPERRDGHGVGRRMLGTAIEYRTVFVRAGFAIMALQLLREVRQVFLPLWGQSIGLDVAQIGLVFGASSFLDASLFYPVGFVMDRWGRKWAGVPSLFTLSLAFVLLPATSGVTGYTLAAILMGAGNGFGAGILMTLGADLSPADRRGEFLGVWRLIGDVGSTGGPLVASLVIGLAGLGAASAVCAGIGFLGAAVMARLVPETLPRRAAAAGRRGQGP